MFMPVGSRGQTGRTLIFKKLLISKEKRTNFQSFAPQLVVEQESSYHHLLCFQEKSFKKLHPGYEQDIHVKFRGNSPANRCRWKVYYAPEPVGWRAE
jgi:hypothetical protein